MNLIDRNGTASFCCCPRDCIQGPSLQSYQGPKSGTRSWALVSCRNPTGSALSTRKPLSGRERDTCRLRHVRVRNESCPNTRVTQPAQRMRRFAPAVEVAMTDTCSALGAHTAKCAPWTRLFSVRCAPNFLSIRQWVPSLNQCRSSALKPVRFEFHSHCLSSRSCRTYRSVTLSHAGRLFNSGTASYAALFSRSAY